MSGQHDQLSPKQELVRDGLLRAATLRAKHLRWGHFVGILGLWIILCHGISLVIGGPTPIVMDALGLGIALVMLSYGLTKASGPDRRLLLTISLVVISLVILLAWLTTAMGQRPWAKRRLFCDRFFSWTSDYQFLKREGLSPFRIGDIQVLFGRLEQGKLGWIEAQSRLGNPNVMESAVIASVVFVRSVLLPPMSYYRWRKDMLARDKSDWHIIPSKPILTNNSEGDLSVQAWSIRENSGEVIVSDDIEQWTIRRFIGAAPG